jgi:hypothetical protein
MNLNQVITNVAAISMLAVCGDAMAHPHPSFRYIDEGYSSFKFDNGLDYGGFVIEGGFKFTNNLFGEVGYSLVDDTADVSGTEFELDFRETRLALGYRYMLTENSDVYLKVGVSDRHGDSSILWSIDAISDSSQSASLGYVFRSNSFQTSLEAQYLKPEDISGEWGGILDVRWFFAKRWSIAAEYETSNIQDVVSISASYHF